MKKLMCSYLILFFLPGCRDQSGKNEAPNNNSKKDHKSVTKPPTIFSDTLEINSKAAVFYYPDSLQLKTIKAGLDSSIYNSVIHEYFYQFRYVHIVLSKYWPGIKIVEAKNVRYLQFVKGDQTNEIIDLNTKNDAYGLYVFDPDKSPAQLELTNAESEIGFYFSTNKPLKSNNR